MKYEPIPLTPEELEKNRALHEKFLEQVFIEAKPAKLQELIDYRSLLFKYMMSVIEVEGISFVDECSIDPSLEFSFTTDEINELNQIFEECKGAMY